jgi:hypothetical protein
MKKGNMFLLGAGYLAGLLVALKFNKKSIEDLEKDFSPSDDRCNTIGKNLLSIHKNLFESTQEALFSAENKKLISEYKERFLVELDAFKNESEVQLTELKKKGFEKKDEVESELRDLYSRRVELLEQVKQKGLKLLEETREDGMDMMEEGKKITNRVFDQAKKQLDAMYADIKSKLSKKE